MQFEIPIIIVSVVWLIGLSVLVLLVWNKLGKLTGGVEGRNLLAVIEQVLDTEKANTAEVKKVKKEIEKINTQDKLHIQKSGLVRFNPFNEMGGDHSFALALLDGHENGFIITGLHTRERTRIYIKPIKNGNSSLELSKEEKKALEIALRNTA